MAYHVEGDSRIFTRLDRAALIHLVSILHIGIMAKSNSRLINVSKESNSPASPEVAIAERKVSWSMIHVGHYQYTAALETPEHYFPQHFISVHLNETAIIKEQRLDGHLQSDSFSIGDICITPATTPVSVRLHAPWEIMGLYLEPTSITQLTAVDAESIQLVPQFKLQDPLIHQMAIALKTQLSSPGEWNRIYVESMATAFSAHLLQHYSTRKPKEESDSQGLSVTRLKQATEYIHEHADQNPSLIEIAQQVSLSPYHFSRLFKQSTGLSPHQYLIDCRITQAKQLLKTTALSISEIAAQSGFTDQSHLARHFKRQFGVPPSQFRTQ